jgi:cardiolipin synthase
VPVFVILLVYSELGWALAVFLAAAATDGLDGLNARRLGKKTSVGAILDPIADKLLMSCSIVLLALPQMNFLNPIPIWLMLLVIFRDVFILLGSLAFILAYGFRVFPPSWSGKLSTMFQLLTLAAVLLFNWLGIAAPGLYFLFILTGLLTALSGIQYLYIVRNMVDA